jgi:hypothetical protein
MIGSISTVINDTMDDLISNPNICCDSLYGKYIG